MRVEELQTPACERSLEEAVRRAEEGTSGEIVPMIVDRSDGYAGVRAAAAALLAFGAGVVALVFGPESRLYVPPLLLVVFGLGFVLVGWRPLLRQLIPAPVAAAIVTRAARLAFLEHGLFDTRDRTGILLYISLLEHRVCVLADRGIDAVVEPGTWDGVVDTILQGIREDRAEEGLVAAIALCGELLAARLPARPEDENELPDLLR